MRAMLAKLRQHPAAVLLLLTALGVGATACASRPQWDDPKGTRAPAEEPVEPGVEADPEAGEEPDAPPPAV